MILDLSEAPDPPVGRGYDVCIAGAGVAGIVLARKLSAAGKYVLVLEAGGLEQTDESQDVYKGKVVGRAYFDLDVARLRFFGGTSNHWGGMSRPLEEFDFLPRPGFVEDGWPIRRADIEPYLAQACSILEVAPFAAEAQPVARTLDFREVEFRFKKVRFREKYVDDLRADPRITVVLNANVLDIPVAPGGRVVASFGFRGYADPRIHHAHAKAFVLALGGIENARALLNANNDKKAGLGNDHDLVGRYFMEHPYADIGYYIASSGKGVVGERFLAPSEALVRAKGIGNCAIMLEPVAEEVGQSFLNKAKKSLKSAICSSEAAVMFLRAAGMAMECPAPHVANRRISIPDFDISGRLLVFGEQAPNPESRIRLDSDTDRFGRRRVALDWRFTATDKRTFQTAALALGTYFAKQNFGRIRLADWVLRDDAYIPGLAEGEQTAGFHHMGTTRMGMSARDGVVDRDCRVFGVENLYVAGSSVFRTAGFANPTLTVVQLALRLGDWLIRRL